MAARSVVFVLAMSRSGTSAITRILSLCGMSLPVELMAPNAGNPTGYWEPTEAVALNDRFLERRTSNYYDPTLFVQSDERAFETEAARAFVAATAAFIDAHARDAPLLIKDPRLVALAPYWFRGAARAGRSIACILPVRDPRAVIASLGVRDGASVAYSNVLWLKYSLLAERLSRRFPRVFVDYAAMLADWRSQVDRVEGELGLPRGRRKKAAIAKFVDPELDHRYHVSQERRPLLPLTETVFEQFSRAARGEAIDTGVMDDAFAAFVASERTIAMHFARTSDAAFYVPGDEVAKWDSLGVRFARVLAKGPPFPSA